MADFPALDVRQTSRLNLLAERVSLLHLWQNVQRSIEPGLIAALVADLQKNKYSVNVAIPLAIADDSEDVGAIARIL